MDSVSNVTEFPGTEQKEGLAVTDEQSEAGTGDFDAGDQAETNKQKVIDISEKLRKIPDKTIVDACQARLEIDQKRKVLNDEAADIRDELKDLGIKGPAFNAAYSRYKQDEHERAMYDQQFAKCANAMGVEFQEDLFNK